MKKKLPRSLLQYFQAEGSRGGKLSAAARLQKLTPERRSEIARKAAAARWAKAKRAK